MEISPDSTVFWSSGPVTLNATIVYTWLVMAILVAISVLTTRRLSPEAPATRWQNLLEAVISYMRGQIGDVIHRSPDRYLPFLGTLYLFIALSNLMVVLPFVHAPTASLSTTVALAIAVFYAVHIYTLTSIGIRGYLRHYIQPTPLMMPFHFLEEVSRTLTLAVRLFGSMMSEFMIAGVVLSLLPFFLPVIMKLFGLLIGQIQAYIFVVLATIYIASAAEAVHRKKVKQAQKQRRRQSRAQRQEA